ncbi:MAG: FtsH protease activity modulator HflK [Alphaproteobacteria bacterium]
MPWDDNTNNSDNGGPWGSSGGSGGGGDRGPWGSGSGGGNQGGGRPGGPRGPGGPGRGGGGDEPPDLEELLKRGQEGLRKLFPDGGSSGGGEGGDGPQIALPGKRLIGLLLLGLIGAWLLTGLYRVNADEQGVVLRFGEYINETQPGLNYHLPYPIETALTPKVTRVNRIDAGFRALGDSAGAIRDVQEESLMLTGDENIVDIDFTVLWRISIASDYLFNLKDPELVVKAVAESVMREVIGRNDIQAILTERRDSIQFEVKNMMQTVLNEYGAGITIQEVQLRKVDPPQEVIESFRDVQAAQADAERMRNEADAYARDVVPRSRGEAERMVQEAMGYKEKAVRTAEGEASRFLAVYGEYAQAKEVTRKRIYLETMEAVMGGMDKVILDSKGGNGVVPYLPLNELRKGAK